MQRFIPVILLALFVVAMLPVTAVSGGSNGTSTPELKDPGTVTVYYFHTDRRCKTCLSIERIARGVVKDKYGDNKRVTFASINIDEDKNAALAERYQVAGSALMVCSGKKKSDLTTKAFSYAMSKPAKLQNALIKAVDGYLK